VNIERALVETVRSPIAIAVDVGHTAATCTGRPLLRVERTQLCAVERAVAIGVCTRRGTATGAIVEMVCCVWTEVHAVRCVVTVCIGAVWVPAATHAGALLG
jgi:hypothetical protein